MSARLLPLVALLPLFLVTAIPRPGRAAQPDPKLAKLCDEFWQGYLEANPTRATSLGDKRFDDRLDDITPRGIGRERKRLQGDLDRALAIDERSLSPQDRLTRAALVTEIEDDLAYISCGLYEWTVDPLGGPQAEFMDLAEYTNIETPEDGSRYVKRDKAMGT